MNKMITTRVEFHVKRKQRGQVTLAEGSAPPSRPRIPRIARLMALAIRFDTLIRDGEVSDQAELARLGLVTRARMTQIMSLLNLAPDIQEQLLDLPIVDSSRAVITERTLRPVVAELDWEAQRAKWERLRPAASRPR